MKSLATITKMWVITVFLLQSSMIFGQNEVVYDPITIYQGSVMPFNMNAPFGNPSLSVSPSNGNSVNFLENVDSIYYFEYVPSPDFLGSDGFSIQVVTSASPFGIEYTVYVFQIEVVLSMVNSHDDFVKITSEDEVLIDPLSNDEFSDDTFTLTLAHVSNGSAVVTSDNKILYTPGAEDNDYIVYNVKDSYGTSSTSTVYTYKVDENPDSSIEEYYQIASGAYQYIFMNTDSFALSSDALSFGSISQVENFVYKYESFSDTFGIEELTFSDGDFTLDVTIKVHEKYNDLGNVKDDLFFSAMNTQLEFDVTTNDIVDQYVISDYSPELIHLGNGVFSYTPTPYFSGIKKFFYTTDNGFYEETGLIEIVVNNFKPTNYFTYDLAAVKNQPRVIEYQVPLGTEYFEIYDNPLHGTLEVFGDDESVDVACAEGIEKVFILYTPNANYVGTDNFKVRYCSSDNNLCSTIDINVAVVENDLEACICVEDCIWPGDANNDGKVSVLDVLPIGRNMGKGGAPREASTFAGAYDGAVGTDWISGSINGVNDKHSDANGDGVVTVDDFQTLVENYGEIHNIITNDILGVKNIPFYLQASTTTADSGDVVEINVIAGNAAYPAIDLNGISFAININPEFIDSASVNVTYHEDGFLAIGSPFVSLTHQPFDGIIHSAGVKTNGLASTGYGIIATLSFIIVDDAEGFKDTKRSMNSKSNRSIANIAFTDIVMEDSKGFHYSIPSSSIDIHIRNKEELASTNYFIYPNPIDNMTEVTTDGLGSISSVVISDFMGRQLHVHAFDSVKNTLIDMTNYPSGVYIFQVYGDKGIESHKVVKR